jgi:hypothetical protein
MLTLNILANNKSREALCNSCAYAVTNKGFEGEVLTFCNYGSELRELKFEVCECTVYTDKNAPKARKSIGYIKPEEEETKPRLTVIKIA